MTATPPLKLGAFFFGGVEMDDAGAGAPDPMDRRYTNEQCWDATQKYVDAAIEAELSRDAAPARTERLRKALVALGRSVHRNHPHAP